MNQQQAKEQAAKATREQWMLAQHLNSAVSACNAPFCSRHGETEAVNSDSNYIENVALLVALVQGCMALEDTISVLQRALEIKATIRVDGSWQD